MNAARELFEIYTILHENHKSDNFMRDLLQARFFVS